MLRVSLKRVRILFFSDNYTLFTLHEDFNTSTDANISSSENYKDVGNTTSENCFD